MGSAMNGHSPAVAMTRATNFLAGFNARWMPASACARPGRSISASREMAASNKALLPGPGRYVEHAIADADPGQVQHPLSQRREDLRAGHTTAPPSRGRLNRSVRSSGLIFDAAFGCHGSVPRLLRLMGNTKLQRCAA